MHTNRISPARKILVWLASLACLLAFSGCESVTLTNLTPPSVPENPSQIYTFSLRVTKTNSGVDSHGAVRFGRLELEGESYLVVLAGVILSILCFLLCGEMGMAARCLVAALPLGLALGWVKHFVHGRPPHFVGDYFEGLLAGPHFRLQASVWARRRHPLRNK